MSKLSAIGRAILIAILIVLIFVAIAVGSAYVSTTTHHTSSKSSISTVTSTTATTSEDQFAISSIDLRSTGGCDCANISISIRNTGVDPITGVNVSTSGLFLGPTWSSTVSSNAYPLLSGNSITGLDDYSLPVNETTNLFLVTVIFGDNNATTESYLWPTGNTSLVRTQPYCCVDATFDSSANCNSLASNSSNYQNLVREVTSNPDFISLEAGRNFTTPGTNCGQSYNTYDIGFTFWYTTDQLTSPCGSSLNVTDIIDVDMLRTPQGYSVPSMVLSAGVLNPYPYGCDISTITVTSGQTP